MYGYLFQADFGVSAKKHKDNSKERFLYWHTLLVCIPVLWICCISYVSSYYLLILSTCLIIPSVFYVVCDHHFKLNILIFNSLSSWMALEVVMWNIKDRPYDYKAKTFGPGYHFNRNGWDRTTSSWIKSNQSAAKIAKSEPPTLFSHQNGKIFLNKTFKKQNLKIYSSSFPRVFKLRYMVQRLYEVETDIGVFWDLRII